MPAYAGTVSAQPVGPGEAGELPEKDLRAIRAALVVPEDVHGFEAGLDRVLADIRETLDVSKLHEFIHTWWLIACDNVRDPQGRAEMYERIAGIEQMAARGEPLPRGGTSWKQLFAERGIEVDL
nr:MAG: hypothetical protein DIU60_02410 [Actinomycetota bacterium]